MNSIEFLSQKEFAGVHGWVLIGECSFQREVISLHLRSTLEDAAKGKIPHHELGVETLPFEELIQLFNQPGLFGKAAIYTVTNTHLLSNDQLKRLIEVGLSRSAPSIKRLLCLSKLPGKMSIEADQRIAIKKLRQNDLSDLIVRLMQNQDIAVNHYIAKNLAQTHLNHPMNVLSELKKLELFMDPESKQYEINEVMDLFSKKDEANPFELLDRLGTRSLERALKEYENICRDQSYNTPRLLFSIKGHFHKLLLLKNWTDPLDELRIFKMSHHYFTMRSKREKESIMKKLRDYYEEQISEEDHKKFNRVFKSDYYLAKLIYQQKFFKAGEIMDVLLGVPKLKA